MSAEPSTLADDARGIGVSADPSPGAANPWDAFETARILWDCRDFPVGVAAKT